MEIKFKDAKNERLWFKTNSKLGKLYFDRKEFGKLEKIIKQLRQSCKVSKRLFLVQCFSQRIICFIDFLFICSSVFVKIFAYAFDILTVFDIWNIHR